MARTERGLTARRAGQAPGLPEGRSGMLRGKSDGADDIGGDHSIPDGNCGMEVNGFRNPEMNDKGSKGVGRRAKTISSDVQGKVQGSGNGGGGTGGLGPLGSKGRNLRNVWKDGQSELDLVGRENGRGVDVEIKLGVGIDGAGATHKV